MTRKKRRSGGALGAPPDRSPKAETIPPPSSQPPASIDRDASERLMLAEGADVPQLLAPRATRRDAAEKKAASAHPTADAAAGRAELPSDPNLAARIRELEERLDRMISTHARERVDDDTRTRESSVPPPPAAPGSSARALPTAAGAEDGHVEPTHDVLATDFYLRKWGRLGLRSRSEEVDEFGYDPVYEQKVLPFF